MTIDVIIERDSGIAVGMDTIIYSNGKEVKGVASMQIDFAPDEPDVATLKINCLNVSLKSLQPKYKLQHPHTG